MAIRVITEKAIIFHSFKIRFCKESESSLARSWAVEFIDTHLSFVEFCLLRLVFLWAPVEATCPPEVSRANVPETVPSTTSTSDTWALHLRLSLSDEWELGAEGLKSTSLGLPATATQTTRSLRSSNLLGLVLTTWPKQRRGNKHAQRWV